MKQIVIFSGTTEGKTLANALAESGIASIVCVASEYGEIVMDVHPLIQTHVGRLNAEEMKVFLEEKESALVVDATHPFAREVSVNIKASAREAGVEYLRLLRDQVDLAETGAEIIYFDSIMECAKALLVEEGNILLTTGSKELSQYILEDSVRGRVIARVLPVEASIELCREAGLKDEQIIAAKGPFSKEQNVVDLNKNHIRVLVTKESGTAGGLLEKAQAAKECGVKVFVIRRPKEDGASFDVVFQYILGKR